LASPIRKIGFHLFFFENIQKHNGCFRGKTPEPLSAWKAPRTANQVLPAMVVSCCPQREQPRIPPGLKPRLLDWGEWHMWHWWFDWTNPHSILMYHDWFNWTILAENIHIPEDQDFKHHPTRIEFHLDSSNVNLILTHSSSFS
jgi:hypothetical protein